MKKLLSMLAATGLVATSSATVISCGDDAKADESTVINKIGDVSLEVGATKTVAVTVKNPVTGAAISVSSSDATIAKGESSLAQDANKEGKFNVIVTALKEGTAKLTVKYGDAKQEFTVKVTSNGETPQKEDLNNVIKVKDLGVYEGVGDLPTIDEVLKQVNTKNSNLILSSTDVEFDGNPTASQVKLKAKTTSTNYTGNVTLTQTYSKTKETTIGTVGDKEIQIGENIDPISVTVANSKGENTLTATSSTQEIVKVQVAPSSTKEEAKFTLNLEAVKAGEATITLKYTGAKDVTFKVTVLEAKKDLNTIGKDLSPKLNKEEDAKTAATEAITKFSAGAKLNTDYTFDQFKAATPEAAGSLKVNSVSTSKLLKSSAIFTLKYVETRTDLANPEIVKDLGTINGKETAATLDMVIKIFNEKNSKYKITKDDVDLLTSNATGGTIKAKSTSENYYGEINLTFKYFSNYIEIGNDGANNTSYDADTNTMNVSYVKEGTISFRTNAKGTFDNEVKLIKSNQQM
ncbi:hypothetical protein SLITO_v1c07110 [Spiroplasma litorale]|uniref:Lipoprotein n=1 Tax=Spiroplasma litorale TaxID=216942 RepID=A0A0K1W2D7_9MOLU|nr:lipoprotein [Spiroplasma litorale]AKX34336.1 hypothetical protein SLITO_v1c07110 [Spiroplasma litorale]